MAKFSEEQLKKLAKVEMIAELDDNFETIEVINSLVYRPAYPAPAATNGEYIIVSDAFFNYTPEEMYFILNHEFLHIYFKHVERFLFKGLDRYITNIATDLIINEMLVTREGQKMIENGVTRSSTEQQINKKILGRTSKEVYNEIKDYLLKEMEEREAEEIIKQGPPKMVEPPKKPMSGPGQGSSSGNFKYKYAPGDYVKSKKTGKVSKVITAAEADPKTGIQKITLQEIDENEIANLNFNELEIINTAFVIPSTNDEVTPYYASNQKDQKDQKDKKDQKDSGGQEDQGDPGDPGDTDGSEESEVSGGSGDSSNLSDKEIEEALDKIFGKDKGKEYKDKIDKEAESAKQMGAENNLTEEEKQQIIDGIQRLKEKIIAKKMQANKKENQEIERNYTPAVVDWKKILQRFLGRHLIRKEARNWRRPTNRYDEAFRGESIEAVLPSNRGYKVTPFINVYLDVSGSMSSIIGLVREELTNAKRFFKQYKAKYHEFDTDIIEINKKSFFSRSGAQGGGTDIGKVITHYMQDKRADLCVLVTDADDEFQKELNVVNKPLLLITNNKKISTNNPKVTLVITDFK